MKAPIAKSPNCTVDKYIGSDFDYVKVVAERIDVIDDIGPAADHLNDIGENLDKLTKLADNIEENQIREEVALDELITIIRFNKILTYAMSVSVIGPKIDKGLLLVERDYTILGDASIQLKRNYPSGTTLIATQVIVAGSEDSPITVFDDKSVFNREVVTYGVGVDLRDTTRFGEVIAPFLFWNNRIYLCHKPLPVVHTITEAVPVDLLDGHINVTTNLGVLNFCEQDARALPQKDIIFMIREAIDNMLLVPASPWQGSTLITSVTHHIQVDGIEYLPKTAPFTTATTWEADKVNWEAIKGRIPTVVKVTSNTLDVSGSAHTVIVSADEPTNVVNFIGVPKYHKVLLIPEDRNITLVHNPNYIRLCNEEPLTLTPNCAYEFYVDHNGIIRQMH